MRVIGENYGRDTAVLASIDSAILWPGCRRGWRNVVDTPLLAVQNDSLLDFIVP
jgi:hypothetical protein